jgi:4-diphosphocytidyl-2C-methyl-D-erythritol kinase
MTNAGLKYINEVLEALDINYEFGEWTKNEIPDPYWVGEYNEVDGNEKEENGFQETTFILTGTGQTWIGLQNDKSTIEKNISKTAILSDQTGIAVFYSASMIIPTGDAELKRIQINLQIKEWSVI